VLGAARPEWAGGREKGGRSLAVVGGEPFAVAAYVRVESGERRGDRAQGYFRGTISKRAATSSITWPDCISIISFRVSADGLSMEAVLTLEIGPQGVLPRNGESSCAFRHEF
jgi:hypothetical protein